MHQGQALEATVCMLEKRVTTAWSVIYILRTCPFFFFEIIELDVQGVRALNGFKSAILAIFRFCKNVTFEPVHEI